MRLVNPFTAAPWTPLPHDRRGLESAALTLAAPLALADLASPGSCSTPSVPRGGDAPVSFPRNETAGMSLLLRAGSGLLGVLDALLVADGLEGLKSLVLLSPLPPMLPRVACIACHPVRDAAPHLLRTRSPGRAVPLRRQLPPAFESALRRARGARTWPIHRRLHRPFANSLSRRCARGRRAQTYYVLGYVPPRPDDGRFRAVKVKVNVRGLTARTKKGYLAGRRR